MKVEGIDVGVFIGDPPESDLVARRVADHQFAICASERYLERHGLPRRPDDLSRHNCIEYLQPDGKSPEWTFQKDGDVQTIPVRGNLKVNDGQAMVGMAAAGIGIARVMQMTAEAMIATGAVILLLTDWKVEDVMASPPASRRRIFSAQCRLWGRRRVLPLPFTLPEPAVRVGPPARRTADISEDPQPAEAV